MIGSRVRVLPAEIRGVPPGACTSLWRRQVVRPGLVEEVDQFGEGLLRMLDEVLVAEQGEPLVGQLQPAPQDLQVGAAPVRDGVVDPVVELSISECTTAPGCRTMPTKTASGNTLAISAMCREWNGVFFPHRCLPCERACRSNSRGQLAQPGVELVLV